MNRGSRPGRDLVGRIADIDTLERLAGVLDTLPVRERDVLILRFGLRDGVLRSLDELARMYDVTMPHIRDVVNRAMGRVSHRLRMVNRGALRELLDDLAGVTVPPHIRERIFPDDLGRRAARVHCDRHKANLGPARHEQVCAQCPCRVPNTAGGRPRRFCSNACRQAAYRLRIASAMTGTAEVHRDPG